MPSTRYLVIGHLALDVVPGGFTPGGTVAYAGMTARALGCQALAVTSVGSGTAVASLLPGLEAHVVPADQDTVFENQELPAGRRQWLHGRATTLAPDDVPAAWLDAPIAHLAPIADEVDPTLIDRLTGDLIGLTPQGWMRAWDGDGRVRPATWSLAASVLPRADAVVLSEEDLVDQAQLAQFRRWSRLLVLTQGEAGCTVFAGQESRHVPAPRVTARSLTGAGDIFAAAFFVHLHRTGGEMWAAARFANQIASASVTREDLSSKVRHVARLMATADV